MGKRYTPKTQLMQKDDTFRKLKRKICVCIIAPIVTATTSLKNTQLMIKNIYDVCFACKKKKLFVRKRQVPISPTLTANSREAFCGKCYKALKKEVTKQFRI